MAASVRTGLTVDGLEETIRALKKLDPQYRTEAVDIFRDAAKSVQKIAQGRIGAGRNRNKTARGMIGRSATGRGAGVTLRASKYPYAYQAEFGQVVGHVYGRPMGESRYRRRVSPTFKPPTSVDPVKNTGGYMIQPALRVSMPRINEKASKEMTALIQKAMRKAGVPRG